MQKMKWSGTNFARSDHKMLCKDIHLEATSTDIYYFKRSDRVAIKLRDESLFGKGPLYHARY